MQKKEKTILVVEDEPAIRELLADTLELEGYTVVTASHPGLGAARAPYADCIVLDLQLTPEDKLEGSTIMSHVWEDAWCNIPIIIFSGMVGIMEVDELLRQIENTYGKGRNIFRYIAKNEGEESVVNAVNDWFESIQGLSAASE